MIAATRHIREGALVGSVAGMAITVGAVEARLTRIRRAEVASRLPMPGSDEDRRLRRWVARLLATEALVAHEAEVMGCAPPPVHRRDHDAAPTANGAHPEDAAWLARAVNALFSLVTADVAVSVHDVEAYYSRNRHRYARPARRRVRHVLVGDSATAAAVLAMAEATDVREVAAAWSIDSDSRERGGDLGWVTRDQLAGPLGDAVFGADVRRLVGPVRTGFGWHVLRVEATAPADLAPFADVRETITADLNAAARGRAFDDWLESRRAALVVMQPDWLHPGDPSLPDAVHRH